MVATKLSPQLATLTARPPEGQGWIHEIKYDGYRILAHLKSGSARLVSRNDKDWTPRFKSIAIEIERLDAGSAVIDGEIVVFEPSGQTSFQALQNSLRGGQVQQLHFMVFDLLELDGVDLRKKPLVERKKKLERLLRKAKRDSVLKYSGHIVGSGPDVFREACLKGLEGIISKKADAPYTPGRGTDWLKCKCINEEEFVIGGFTTHRKQPKVMGALLLGRYTDDGRLVFCGKVGTGFSSKKREEMFRDLGRIASNKCPFAPDVQIPAAKGTFWVKPVFLAQIRYREITKDGILRQPSYTGMREDKSVDELKKGSKTARRIQ